MEKLYQAKHYRYCVEISQSRYDSWLNKKIIVPDVKPRRSGSRAGWTFQSLVKGRLIKHLAEDCKLLVAHAQEVAEEAEKIWSDGIHGPLICGLNLADPTHRIYFKTKDKIKAPWKATLLIDFEKFIIETTAVMRSMMNENDSE